MTKSEKEAISQKEIDLMISKIRELNLEETYNSFENKGNFENQIRWSYDLPFGYGSSFIVLFEDGIFWACFYFFYGISKIRKIESPEDLQLLFDAICPEKYRLPFG